MEAKNKKEMCIDIIAYMSVITGFDFYMLTDDDIILILENLQKLSDNNLLDLGNTLYTIYYEQSHKEE